MSRKYIYAVYYRARTDCFYSKHYFPTMALAKDFYDQFIDLGFYSFIKKIPILKGGKNDKEEKDN